MNVQDQINQIAEILQDFEEGLSMWDDKLLVKSSPHNEICRLYGVCVDPKNEIWLYDGDKWYTLEATDHNADYVAASVLQKIKRLKAQLA